MLIAEFLRDQKLFIIDSLCSLITGFSVLKLVTYPRADVVWFTDCLGMRVSMAIVNELQAQIRSPKMIHDACCIIIALLES